MEKRLLGTEMDLWRCCRKTTLDKVSNRTIRGITEVNRNSSKENQKRQLIWYGLSSTMGEDRCTLHAKILEWIRSGVVVVERG